MTALVPYDFLATLLGDGPAQAMLTGAELPDDRTPIGHRDF